MINFLVVDDNINNIEILELLIDDHMENKKFEENNYTIYTSTDGLAAIDLVQKKQIDILFLDIMMPQISGFEVLSKIRSINLTKQPIIIMATALGDDITKERERQEGANAFMVKPFGKKTLAIVLDNYLNKITNSPLNNIIDNDDFFEFDDLDTEFTIENQKEIMDRLNESHKDLSTKDFLAEYDHILDEIFLDLEEINCLLMKHFNLEDDNLNLEKNKKAIEDFFDSFYKLLLRFSEFEELASSVLALEELFSELEIDKLTIEEKEMIGIYIKAIIMDLNDWKEHVFVSQNAKNVFYANASLFSSYLEVKELINSTFENKNN